MSKPDPHDPEQEYRERLGAQVTANVWLWLALGLALVIGFFVIFTD